MRSPIITICIACTARSMARRPRNVPAHPYLLLPRLVVTPGGSIAAVCSKHQLPPDWQFTTHRPTRDPLRRPQCAIGGRPLRGSSDLGTATFEVCPCKRVLGPPHQIPK